MNDAARKARLCLGLAIVLLVLLSETVVAHQRLPSPWSPWVWGCLGLGAALCLGLAANRSALSLERVGINVDDARIPDNAGAQPIDQPAVPGAPAAYFATLPIKAMVAAMQAEGLPAEVSQTAGTFVCNGLYAALLADYHRHLPAIGAKPPPIAPSAPECSVGAAITSPSTRRPAKISIWG